MANNPSPLFDDQPQQLPHVSARDQLMSGLNLSSDAEIADIFAGMNPANTDRLRDVLNLSGDELVRLRRVAPDLSSIAALHLETGAAATGIDLEKIERIHNLAVELLNDPEIYSVESDRVNFTALDRG